MAQSKKAPKTPKESKKAAKPVLTAEEYQVKKQELFDKAKKEGTISQRDIFDEIPETAENTEILDALYTELADASIIITATTEPDPANFTSDWAEEEEPEEEEDTSKAIYVDDDVADDSVRLYLREIGKIPLLNAEEELTLAKRVVAGDPAAKHEMAEANMRLVVSIAKRYVGRA